ncbi:MAG: HD domain-containing protein [Paraprevotella sp.]|nr:HD domain-containing protein [Bacteroides sp.]MCM1515743.1 HD domain-containing protein [Paraprevotella sp.]
MDPTLRDYVETIVIPLYDEFDKGHGRDHVEAVIAQALSLCVRYDVNPSIVYAAAAYHDAGLCEDRPTHHLVSARMIRSEKNLRQWFTKDEINIIADAAEDHRASLGHEPRTIYGKLVAESDRLIVPETVIRRCIQYGLSHFPDYGKETQFARVLKHIESKYGEDGYLQLWIPESPNVERIKELREIIKDRPRFRRYFDEIYQDEVLQNSATL